MSVSPVVRSVTAAALVGLALTACSSSSSAGAPEPRKGNPATYQRIAQSTDCVGLQAEFDRFDRMHGEFIEQHDLTNAEISTDYMAAVDDRMRAIGCYK